MLGPRQYLALGAIQDVKESRTYVDEIVVVVVGLASHLHHPDVGDRRRVAAELEPAWLGLGLGFGLWVRAKLHRRADVAV